MSSFNLGPVTPYYDPSVAGFPPERQNNYDTLNETSMDSLRRSIFLLSIHSHPSSSLTCTIQKTFLHKLK